MSSLAGYRRSQGGPNMCRPDARWPDAACLVRTQECGILKSLNYDKNIVQFLGAVLRPGAEPMLVLEFMEVRCT